MADLEAEEAWIAVPGGKRRGLVSWIPADVEIDLTSGEPPLRVTQRQSRGEGVALAKYGGTLPSGEVCLPWLTRARCLRMIADDGLDAVPALCLGGDEETPSDLGGLVVLDVDVAEGGDAGRLASAMAEAGLPTFRSRSGRGLHGLLLCGDPPAPHRAPAGDGVAVDVFVAGLSRKLVVLRLESPLSGEAEVPVIDEPMRLIR